MNHSKQREIVKSLMVGRKDHPTALVLYDEARTIDPKISLGTVYRNLNQLAENKEISKLAIDSEAHFDPNTINHIHFVCRKCKKIYDIESIDVNTYKRNFSKKIDGTVDDVDIVCYGICDKCKKKP